jgi:hypothetical protein
VRHGRGRDASREEGEREGGREPHQHLAAAGAARPGGRQLGRGLEAQRRVLEEGEGALRGEAAGERGALGVREVRARRAAREGRVRERTRSIRWIWCSGEASACDGSATAAAPRVSHSANSSAPPAVAAWAGVWPARLMRESEGGCDVPWKR